MTTHDMGKHFSSVGAIRERERPATEFVSLRVVPESPEEAIEAADAIVSGNPGRWGGVLHWPEDRVRSTASISGGAVLDLSRSYPTAVLQLVLYHLSSNSKAIGNETGIMAFLMHARDYLPWSQQLRGKRSSNCLPG